MVQWWYIHDRDLGYVEGGSFLKKTFEKEVQKRQLTCKLSTSFTELSLNDGWEQLDSWFCLNVHNL